MRRAAALIVAAGLAAWPAHALGASAPPLLGAHPTLKHDNVSCKFRQLDCEVLEVVSALRE